MRSKLYTKSQKPPSSIVPNLTVSKAKSTTVPGVFFSRSISHTNTTTINATQTIEIKTPANHQLEYASPTNNVFITPAEPSYTLSDP